MVGLLVCRAPRTLDLLTLQGRGQGFRFETRADLVLEVFGSGGVNIGCGDVATLGTRADSLGFELGIRVYGFGVSGLGFRVQYPTGCKRC